jgi:type I restriction enzyme, S subunit
MTPETVPLSKVADLRGGYAFKSQDYRDSGHFVLRTVNISDDGRISRKGAVYISESQAPEYERFQLRGGDTLFVMVGATLGKVGYVKGSDLPALLNQNMWVIRALNSSETSPRYINYWFQWEVQKTLQWQSGSARGFVKRDDYRSLPFPNIKFSEQQTIAAVLGSLDDKIDLLHRQNKTLEAMAASLFRQWFVEEAHEDLEDGTIADLIEFNPPRKLAKGSIAPYLEMAALSNATFSPDGWYDREFSSGTKFINGDTLLARITPCLENGKTAYVTFLQDGQVAWGSTEYIVMRPKGSLHSFFAYTLARNDDFRDYAEGCLAGSSGRQRVDVDHLKNYKIKIPSKKVIGEFNAFAESAVPKLHSNSMQIRTLETLRDTLLPKLMSGEVRIEI